jgi:hypothetical protein
MRFVPHRAGPNPISGFTQARTSTVSAYALTLDAVAGSALTLTSVGAYLRTLAA